jgi:hypothetical protein
MSIDDEIKAQQKLHPTLSVAFKRLEEIFVARYQPWCHFSGHQQKTTVSLPYTEADLRNAIHELHKDELARALVRACIHGDLHIAKLLWGARGPFQIEHTHQGLQEVINGSAVRPSTEAQHTLTNVGSSQDLAELMEWLPTVGLGFMVGYGSASSFLLASDDMDFAIKNVAWKSHFQGTLPTLAEGVVSQPELMLALKQKAENSAYAKSYSDILVWATPQMIAEFPGQLSPYRASQGLKLESTTKEPGKDPELKFVPFDQCDEALMNTVTRNVLQRGQIEVQRSAWNFYGFDLTLEPLERYQSAGLIRSEMVLGYMATEPMQYGFDQKPHHQLCRTNTEFLGQFPIGHVEDRNLQAATDFTKDYFPLDLVVNDNGPDKVIYGSCIRPIKGIAIGDGRGSADTERLYKLLGDDSPIRDHAREALSRPLMQVLIDLKPKVSMDAGAMLALHQAYGMDNAGLSMTLEANDLQKLHDAGFKFCEQTVTRLPHVFGSKLPRYERQSGADTDVFLNLDVELTKAGVAKSSPEAVNAYANAIRMGLWPAETQKPKSMEDALRMAARRRKWGETNQEMALKSYINDAGIESCVQAAKKDSHWFFLDAHFGREALTPYLKLTSRATRGRLLEGDLGL